MTAPMRRGLKRQVEQELIRSVRHGPTARPDEKGIETSRHREAKRLQSKGRKAHPDEKVLKTLTGPRDSTHYP